MSAALQWYDATDTIQNPSLTFTATAGTPTPAQTVRLWNDKAGALGAATAQEVAVTAYSRAIGSGSYSWDHVAAALRWVEVRAVAASGSGIVAQVTPWVPIGRAAMLELLPIPKNCARTLEVRLNAPVGVGTVQVEVLLRAYSQAVSIPLDSGAYFSPLGVHTGITDPLAAWITRGGICTPSITPNNNFILSNMWVVCYGRPLYVAGATYSTTNTDGSGAPLNAGEAYPITVSVSSSGTIVQTKGNKGSDPLPLDAWPPVPSGHVLVALIERPASGGITASRINQSFTRWGAGELFYSSSSLDVTIQGLYARVNRALIRRESPITLTLPASTTSIIYATDSGAIASEPESSSGISFPYALALWRVVTSGSGVSDVESLRHWIAGGGHAELLQATFSGNLSVNRTLVLSVPYGGTYWLPQVDSITAALGSAGSGTGNTSIDVALSINGGAFTSFLASPITIPAGASNPFGTASPIAFRIPPRSRIRVVVTSVPSTVSAHLGVSIPLLRPGQWYS